MAKTHYIRFLIKDQADLIVEVRKREADRLAKRLHDAVGESAREGFFWFDSVDGRSIAINLQDVQAVRLLWDLAELPPDTKRHDDQLSVYLRGRAVPIEDNPENFDDVYDLFTNLEFGPETVIYPKLIDEDGEPIYFDAREIVMVVAPTEMLQEAGRRIAREDGLDDET